MFGSFLCMVLNNDLISFFSMLLLFSCSVMSYSLWPHGLQQARFPCPSASPGACSNLCSLNQWCHPTISSSVIPFFCLQSFAISGSFPMSWLFASGAQSIGASASVLPMNIQGCFFYDWSPCCPRDSQESSPAPQFENINSLALSFLYGLTLTFIHDNWKSHLLLLFSPSVVSDSLQSHRLQHTSLSCPSPSPRACSDSYPLSRWCRPTISSSVIPFSSSLLSFAASGSFPVSWLFTSDGQSIGFQSQHQSFQWIFRIDFL